MAKARTREVLFTLRRGYRDERGEVRRGYDYVYGPGRLYLEKQFIAALQAEFERLWNPNKSGPKAGWIEVDVNVI